MNRPEAVFSAGGVKRLRPKAITSTAQPSAAWALRRASAVSCRPTAGPLVLFSAGTKRLLEMQQTGRAGELIPITLGWHIGKANDVVHFFKEGGGGGFHSEMRIYPARAIASVVMVNATEFNSTQFLNCMDQMLLEP